MYLIFDFDGVICDSFKQYIKLFIKTAGIKSSLDFLAKEIREKGTKEIIKDLKLSHNDVGLFVNETNKQLTKYIPYLRPFPNICSVIARLSRTNFLGILTSNKKVNVQIFLRKNRVEKYFKSFEYEAGVFKKDIKLKEIILKNNLNKNDTYYIGDQIRDIEAAKSVGVKSIAVTWGYESKKLLLKSSPDYLIDEPYELTTLPKIL